MFAYFLIFLVYFNTVLLSLVISRKINKCSVYDMAWKDELLIVSFIPFLNLLVPIFSIVWLISRVPLLKLGVKKFGDWYFDRNPDNAKKDQTHE